MARKFNYRAIIDDEQAEGSAPSAEPADGRQFTQSTQAARTPNHGSPIAETGLIRKITLPNESHDSTDWQDAARTSAETISYALQPQREGSKMTAEPTVLIIEDTPELIEFLEATLKRMNMKTVSESHGMRGFARYSETQPAIVLLDIMLPDVSGWKVLDNIKEEHQRTGTPMPAVIVITAMGDPANRVVGKLQGVHSYLTKPFTTDEVENAIRSALGDFVS